jgi:hypothetical protein
MNMERQLQHWEKITEVEGIKFRIKKLSPFEFPAFKTSFAKATNDNDPEGIAKSYEMMVSWVETEIAGVWVKVYNKTNQTFVIDKFNDPMLSNKLIDVILTEMVMPLFMSTAE